MKVVAINSVNFGSTGNIMCKISDAANESGICSVVSYPKSNENSRKTIKDSIIIGNRISRNLHIKLAEITGYQGCFSYFSTLNFLHCLDTVNPDIIHLHNLHNCYINLPILFNYVKKHNIRIVWTLHDCWAFTAQCPYFTIAKCDKWIKGCHDCVQYNSEYPATRIDKTKKMWKLKKEWFTGVDSIDIITPSKWLAGLVKESFLGKYNVNVINNGIDLSVFKPTENDFRKKYHISEDKYIVLGVAFDWGKRKGLDVFVQLEKRLDIEKYVIVLVGTSDDADKMLSQNIISIHRTLNKNELAGIYTAADVFANPTREENFPTVNMESLACGTPVVTFNTGGSPESLNESCGMVVPCDDIDAMEDAIVKICEEKLFSSENCVKRASDFDMNKKYREYIDLYLKK